MKAVLILPTPIDDLVAYINTRMRELNLSQRAVAKAARLPYGTLSNILIGRVTKAPSVSTLEALALGLRVDPQGLIDIARGARPAGYVPKGEMPGNADQAIGKDSPAGQNYAAEGILSEAGTVVWKHVPLYGPAAAGVPLMWTADDAIGSIPVPHDANVDAGFIVDGDSVSARGIFSGDIVQVRRLNGERPDDGKLVVVEVEGSYICKVYRKVGNAEFLESHRVGETPQVLIFNEEVRLIGEAVYHTRRL